MKSPCYRCERRHELCWNDCEEYRQYRDQVDAARHNYEQVLTAELYERDRAHRNKKKTRRMR